MTYDTDPRTSHDELTAPDAHYVVTKGDDATFVCTAAADAACHRYPDCECEFWTTECFTEGRPVHNECWIVPWINADIEASMHPEEPIRQGAHRVVTDWTGDGVVWFYEEEIRG